MPPIEDFIRDRAEPMAMPTPPASPARPAAPAAAPAAAPEGMPAGTIGQTIDSILQAIEQAGPEVMRWAQEVSTIPAEMKALREQLDRIEALLTRPEVP